MRTRRAWLAAGVLGALLGWYALGQRPAPAARRVIKIEVLAPRKPSVSAPTPQAELPVSAAADPAQGSPSATAGSAPLNTPPAAAAAQTAPASAESTAAPTPPVAKIEADKVRLMIRSYHDVMGENPVGTNAEIMQALLGRNPKQARLGPPEGQSLNAQGELVDQWGTPFFFHQLSRDAMEIRSAGPDKILGTPDDVVAR